MTENLDKFPATDKKRILLGFTQPDRAYQVVTQIAREGGTTPLTDETRFKNRYKQARQAIEPIQTDLGDPTLRPLPDTTDIQSHLEQFTKTNGFDRIVGEHSWEIARVPIQSLICIQSAATATMPETIPAWEDDPLAVVQQTLPIERTENSVHRTFSTERMIGIEYSSRSPNLQADSLQIVDGSDPMEEKVIISVRASPNMVWVDRINGRLVLRDGYHRAVQYRQAGATHLPALVRDADDVAEISTEDDLFSTETIDMDRPPVIPDFDTDAAVTVEMPATNRFIRIAAETTDVIR